MHNDEAGRIHALAAILRDFDLDSVRVRIGETEYELVGREPVPAAPVTAVPAAGRAVAAAGEPAPAAGGSAPAGVKRVTAPLVGVFYAAPSPGAEPFVGVGDRVVPGQVLCILEAMKLMNEITSEFAGVVSRVIPDSGQLVSLGDDLFWIEP
ncbi:MAG TPA: biotin/lipoyl-containing protein [Candidatus Lustribacter sp.]|jgi:acetyl-CoA carboxylase biotin carboxyl carrier protein|nr:biotin/lipoyl-containing protein [Candidatus Lustribacter sp.]